MKQVYIGRVVELQDVENSDRLSAATVVCGEGGRWHGVVGRDQFGIDDLVEVYLPDSLLPKDQERFEFMAARGYRVRQARFRGAVSEVLIMPLTVEGWLGKDITEQVGVEKYEKPIPASIRGEVKAGFPSHTRKTDELHLQFAPYMLDYIGGHPYYISLKYDGTSGTAYNRNGEFGVCSRRVELVDTPNSVFWQVARKFNLEYCLPYNTSIQFELIGPGVQKNPSGEKALTMRVFQIFDNARHEYWPISKVQEFCKDMNLPMVDILEMGDSFNMTEEELRAFAEKVTYANGKPAEGIVVRPQVPMWVRNEPLTFKVINLKYKD